MGGTTQLSLDRSTVWKEILQPKSIWNTAEYKILAVWQIIKQKRTYLHSDGLIKWLFRTKLEMSVLLACYIVSYDTFCLNPSHAAIKISINATAAEFICKNIFPTPVQIKKMKKNKIGDIQQYTYIRMFVNFQQCWLTSIRLFIKCKFILFY